MTFVEIMVAGTLAVLVVGGLIYAFTQFRRGFEKGEGSAIVLQEGALFLGMLRSDLINAVMDRTLPPDRWREAALRVTPAEISFMAFRDAAGNMERVAYAYSPSPGGGSITRTQGSTRVKTLVNKRVASLTWNLGEETAPGVGSGVRRIWLDLDITLGTQGKPGMTSKPVVLSTKLFPTRLNRQLNGRN